MHGYGHHGRDAVFLESLPKERDPLRLSVQIQMDMRIDPAALPIVVIHAQCLLKGRVGATAQVSACRTAPA